MKKTGFGVGNWGEKELFGMGKGIWGHTKDLGWKKNKIWGGKKFKWGGEKKKRGFGLKKGRFGLNRTYLGEWGHMEGLEQGWDHFWGSFLGFMEYFYGF